MVRLKEVWEDTITDTFAIFFPSETILQTTMFFKAVTTIDEKACQVDGIEIRNGVRYT